MSWLGKAKIEFFHAPSPITLTTKDGKLTDLLRVCALATPPCNLHPLLFNGHLQTMWNLTKPTGPLIYYRRKIFEADQEPYKGSFAVDFVVESFMESNPALYRRTVYFTDDQLSHLHSNDSKPMLVVLPGLSGGSHEVYLRQVIAPLVGAGGWEVCVVNPRGCAKSKLTSGILHGGRATWDVRQTVEWLRDNFPNRPLFGLGFSLGANILTNYCGDEGADCKLKAVVACSNPFDLELSIDSLRSTLVGKELYLRFMLGIVKELFKAHQAELHLFTGIDFDEIRKTKYLYEFDRVVQCRIGGYSTESEYYRHASSTNAIAQIRVPFLAIQATDDPIAVAKALPYEEFRRNRNTVMLTTSSGGHMCWFERGGTRWCTKPISNFLNTMAFEIDWKSERKKEMFRPELHSQTGSKL